MQLSRNVIQPPENRQLFGPHALEEGTPQIFGHPFSNLLNMWQSLVEFSVTSGDGIQKKEKLDKNMMAYANA